MDLLTIVPFGANFPDIGVNTSDTAINLHTPNAPVLTGCGSSNCGLGQLNWNTTGPIFPTNRPVVINSVTYTGPTCTAPTTVGGPGPCATGAVTSNFRQAHAAEWNLDVQRAITNNLTVDVAYVGNHGFDEETSLDLNQPKLGASWNTPFTAPQAAANGLPARDVGLTSNQVCLASAPACTACGIVNSGGEVGPYCAKVPYLNFIAATGNGNSSNYDALQVTLQERTAHGLSFLAGYTFAHALDTLNSDNSGGAFVPTDSTNLRLDYGNGDQDLRQRFTFSPSYAIPGIKSPGQMLEGWAVSGILTLQYGLPWTANDQSDDYLGTNDVNFQSSGPSGTIQPWNYSGPRSAFTSAPQSIPCFGSMSGCEPYATAGGIPAACTNTAMAAYPGNSQLQQLALAALTNQGCYVQGGGVLTPPAYGTVGNAGRNSFRGPAYYNVDLSIAKNWKFRERYSAQFRVEFFNLYICA